LEEFDRERSIPLTFEEIEENLELARWFRRRYPTGEARSAYIRQAMNRWLRRP